MRSLLARLARWVAGNQIAQKAVSGVSWLTAKTFGGLNQAIAYAGRQFARPAITRRKPH